MNAADREEMDDIRDELDASKVSALSKHAVKRAMSLSALAANGCPPEERAKKTAESVAALAIVGARTLLELHSVMENHVVTCPLKTTGPVQVLYTASVARNIDLVVTALRPVLWPLALALSIIGASGNLKGVIDSVREWRDPPAKAQVQGATP